jgi:hypothetical protein
MQSFAHNSQPSRTFLDGFSRDSKNAIAGLDVRFGGDFRRKQDCPPSGWQLALHPGHFAFQRPIKMD